MNYDPNPPRVEDTDPQLAEQIQLIAEGRHPEIARLEVLRDSIRYYLRDGTVKIKRVPVPGRNDPCQCGSGKKYKKCCGR